MYFIIIFLFIIGKITNKKDYQIKNYWQNIIIKFLYMHHYKIIIMKKIQLQKLKYVTHPIIFI